MIYIYILKYIVIHVTSTNDISKPKISPTKCTVLLSLISFPKTVLTTFRCFQPPRDPPTTQRHHFKAVRKFGLLQTAIEAMTKGQRLQRGLGVEKQRSHDEALGASNPKDHICTYIHIYNNIIHTCIYIYTYTYVYIYIYTYIYIYSYTCIYSCVLMISSSKSLLFNQMVKSNLEERHVHCNFKSFE